MFWKKKQPSAGEVAADLVQSLGADISHLVCEANDAFDRKDFKRAGDVMFCAALAAWGIAGIQIEAEIAEILSKETEVTN